MPEKKSRFVLLSRQALAVGTVAALAAPALGVASLEIVSPTPESGADQAAVAPASVALVASEPVEPEVTEVPLDGVDKEGLQALTDRPRAQRKAAAGLAALSEPEKVEGYATVGVTWDERERIGEDEITVEVRTRMGDDWGPWEEIEYHDEHGPDPDSPEGRRARQGTEPIVVGDVDEVQVKVETEDGKAPVDTELVVVDPKDTPQPRVETPAIDTGDLPEEGAAALSSATTGATTVEEPLPVEGEEPVGEEPVDEEPAAGEEDTDGVLSAAAGVTPKPRIFSRAQWGADESLRHKSSLRYYEVHAGFVHHTVNSNSYTRADVPQLLRGIYAYHTKGRGWSDIGYNFIVDKFGRIWEGRYGGVDRPVVGAHTSGYNEYSFAMSALGNFDTARPGSALVNAYGRLFAWKLALHGVSASSSSQKVGKRYFPAVNGHRDAGSTACPGRFLYAKLGQIRTLAADYQKPFSSRGRTADVAGSSWPDLVMRDSSTKEVKILRTGGQANFARPKFVSKGWRGHDIVEASPDLNGDGIPDMVARNRRTKVTYVYPGTRQGTFGRPVFQTRRFRSVDQLLAPGDVNGDGKNDLVARMAGTGELSVYPGTGRARFRFRKVLSRSWAPYNHTAGAGDLTGDGRVDLVARRAGGKIFLFPGTRRGIGSPRRLPGLWGAYTIISGGGDLTGDGRADLLVKTRRSKMVFIVPATGNARLGRRLGPFGQFRGMNYLGVPGQLAGDGMADLVGRDGLGRLRVYAHNGGRNVEAVQSTGLRVPHANLLLNVGDWNGDGHADLMERRPGGGMFLYPGKGNGRFGSAVRTSGGWRRVQLITAAGDVTGDGYPDLMGQPAGRAMRIYPSNGATGFRPSYVAHSAISSTGHTGLGLWDSDGSPDNLLRRSDGSLTIYRGNGPGGLTSPKSVGGRTGGFNVLQGVGDATGDGRPDVVARDRAGTLYLLAGTARGFAAPRLLAEGFGRYDLVG